MTWLLALVTAPLAFAFLRAIGWRAGWAFLATAVMFVAVGRIKRQSDH